MCVIVFCITVGSLQFAGVEQLHARVGSGGEWVHDGTEAQVQVHEENRPDETQGAAHRATAGGRQKAGLVHPTSGAWSSAGPVLLMDNQWLWWWCLPRGCGALVMWYKIVQSESLITFSAEHIESQSKNMRLSNALDSVCYIPRMWI